MLKYGWMSFVIVAGSPLLAPAIANAADRAPQLQRLVDCKSIADSAARLACFDREVAAIDTAERSKDLVVVEKEQVRKARRSLFGLSLPRIDFLAGEQAGDELKQIESKVAKANEVNGGWRVVLDDGSVWQQIDDKPMFRDPKHGDAVVITRGALGSYVMKIGTIPGIKVRRIV